MTPHILVAGVGNVLLGDDGFGVAVARRLAAQQLPANVRVHDFGIRGLDLAFALLDAGAGVILVDTVERGGPPGTLYVIEPDDSAGARTAGWDSHHMNLGEVFRLVQALGGRLPPLRLVGCEPASFGGPEGTMALSEPVAAAVEPAAQMVLALVEELFSVPEPGGRA